MNRLVEDLLDVSRITRGKIDLKKDTIDLRVVVENALQTSRPFLQERNHDLSLSLPEFPLVVHGDATRLEQVLVNLLNNAAKFTEPEGRITLAAERDGDAALLRVRDTGRGIPQEKLPGIFDLFNQANPSLDRAQGGLGLGLTLVDRLVRKHGGTVTATSEGPGCGSEFVVRLPLSDSNLQAMSPPRPLEAGTGESFDVLLVDDNVDAAETMRELLELWGHRVRVAHAGHAALGEADARAPDLVLLDVGLPDMDGYEVARTLKAGTGTADIPLIAITGYGQEHDRRRATEAGFDHHLVKPVEPEGLQALLTIIGQGRGK
jgi:CheY-like chemotaxis protein/two-component sensor histidine kinase